ncbi:MAG TPA: hypothetical protein VFE55_20055 [Acidimicrobiia bacterium]|nr:hypothetical protein [Acidimicrobiia bacterium]
MRDPSASVEFATAAWADLPPGAWSPGPPDRPDKAKIISRGMLALGAGLVMVVPVAGALFLAAGVLGLAIASEPPVSTASQPQPLSPTDQ